MKPINAIFTLSFRLSTCVALGGISPTFFAAVCFAENLEGIDDVTMQVIRADQLPDDVYEIIPFPRRNTSALPSVSRRGKSVNIGNESLSSNFSSTPGNQSQGKRFLSAGKSAGKIGKQNGIDSVINLPGLPTAGDNNLILPGGEFPMEPLDQVNPDYDFSLGGEIPPGIDPLTGATEFPNSRVDGTIPTGVNMDSPVDIDPATGLPTDINQDRNDVIVNPSGSDPVAPPDPNGTVR